MVVGGGKGAGSFRQKLPTAGGKGQGMRQTGWSKGVDGAPNKKWVMDLLCILLAGTLDILIGEGLEIKM